MFYNTDCVEGARQYLRDASVDLIITDPPYGIGGDTLHKHYNRKACGFEKSGVAFSYQMNEIEKIVPGSLLSGFSTPPPNKYFNQGKPMAESEKNEIHSRYLELKKSGMPKKQIMEILGRETGRGPWSLSKILSTIK